MERKIRGVLIISGITTIIIAVFLVLYYRVYNNQYTGPMDWWAIVLLSIPTTVMICSRILVENLNIEIDESFKDKNLFGKINILVNKVVVSIASVLILPLLFLNLILMLLLSCFNLPGKKTFKKLISKGFQYSYENKIYILTRNEIVIRIFANFEDFFISFDYGKTFDRVEESRLGLQYNRDFLKGKLEEYRTAHPVDKQRGDAVPPVAEFIDFLDHNLAEGN